LPLFLVFLTIADLTKRRQNIFLTHNQRRLAMRISQAIVTDAIQALDGSGLPPGYGD
jgi:hypothetical protein